MKRAFSRNQKNLGGKFTEVIDLVAALDVQVIDGGNRGVGRKRAKASRP
jgi:hypothetical protein